MQQLPRDVWPYRVGALDVADLSDASRLARVGLTLPRPGRKGWPPYQDVGEELWREGWRGLVAPSAARPDGRVLCLFLEKADVSPAEAIAPPTVVGEAPVPPTGMRT
jgi:RES domain-containing protein